MATIKATAFVCKARAAATALEIAYRTCKKVSQEWFALGMATDIPNNSTLVDEGIKPLTGADITNIITRCDAIISDFEASSNAKLNVIIKGSDAPVDWRS